MGVALAFAPRTSVRPHGLSTLGSRQCPELVDLELRLSMGSIKRHTQL
jgi:hypothetical protein